MNDEYRADVSIWEGSNVVRTPYLNQLAESGVGQKRWCKTMSGAPLLGVCTAMVSRQKISIEGAQL